MIAADSLEYTDIKKVNYVKIYGIPNVCSPLIWRENKEFSVVRGGGGGHSALAAGEGFDIRRMK